MLLLVISTVLVRGDPGDRAYYSQLLILLSSTTTHTHTHTQQKKDFYAIHNNNTYKYNYSLYILFNIF